MPLCEICKKISRAGLALVAILSLCAFIPVNALQASHDKTANSLSTAAVNSSANQAGKTTDGGKIVSNPAQTIKVTNEEIRPVVFSPDGKYLAVGYKSGVNIYNALTMAFLKKVDLGYSANTVDQLAFSLNGRLLNAATHHNETSQNVTTIDYVWDLEDWAWTSVTTITEGDGMINGVGWDDTGHKFTLGREKTDLEGNGVYQYALDGYRARSYESPKVSSMMIDPYTKRMYIGSTDGYIYVYDSENGNFINRVTYHASNINSMALNITNQVLVAGDEDGNIMALSTKQDTPYLIREKNVSFGKGISITPDASLIAYCTSKGNLAVSDLNILDPIQTLYSGTDQESCNTTAFSATGTTLAGGFSDGNIQLYTIEPTTLAAHALVFTAPSTPSVKNAAVSTTDFFKNYTSVPVPTLTKKSILDSNVDQIKILEKDIDLDDLIEKYKDEFKYPVEFNGTGGVTWFAKGPDGNDRAEIVDSSVINITDSNKQVRLSLATNNAILNTLAYASKGDSIAAGATDGSVFVWNTRNGEKKCQLFSKPYKVRAVQFNHQGSILAIAYDNAKIDLYRVEDCAYLVKLPDTIRPVNRMDFSPDDQYLVSAAVDTTIQLFKIKTQESMFTLTPDYSRSGLYTAAYSPDGTLVAAGSYEGILDVWNINSRDFRKRLEVGADDNPITTLIFSKDGAHLFVCLKDKTCDVLGFGDN